MEHHPLEIILLSLLHLAAERIGFEITGPTPDLIFTSTPIPKSGVTISL